MLTADQIADLRRVYSLSQQAFAEQIGISRVYVTFIESRERPVTSTVSAKVVEKFALDVQKLAEISEIANKYRMEAVD
ncbi:helix-turn-helix transcriptional regulator [Alkalihalobacillus sp. LMS6]|uniref:helix-turn-helix domain-containing protein n=1 Tax=Alkalihalobacillus sp. LMS6 TaxID=2924034 RepID=UPI0020D133CD|nr:helix-turn-helix transcriptional regulator [Alkalihalobacillus sp. LMS6]UTR05199.1 helix-turn-helix transcriptional regulator [Alkalihalobacillus sp. LMS6]